MGKNISLIFLHALRKVGHIDRVILNLKKSNTSVEAPQFKLESIKNVTSMIRKNSWMASVNPKDAYFTIPIHPDHQALVRF